MIELENKVYITKADASETIDVTSEVTNINLEKGSVSEMGNTYTDSPTPFLDLTLMNTNDKLYSPQFERYSVKFNQKIIIVGDGNKEYDLPTNCIDVFCEDENYFAQVYKGKIIFDKELNETVNLQAVFIDTNTLNPINHLADNSYSPLILEGNLIGWEQNKYETEIFEISKTVKNTDNIIIDFENVDSVEIISYKLRNFTLYENLRNMTYEKMRNISIENLYGYKETADFISATVETVETIEGLREQLYTDLRNELYTDLLNENYESTSTFQTKLNFSRFVEDEYMKILIKTKKLVDANKKFVGKITDTVSSSISNCSFQARDLSYDFVNKKIEPNSFRNYYSMNDDTGIYVLQQQLSTVNIASNVFTVFFDEEDFIFLGQKLYFFKDNNFTEATVTEKNGNLITLDFIEDGEYSVYIRFQAGIPLPIFIQNCIDDFSLNYQLVTKQDPEFNILPKQEIMQYQDLWSMLQAVVSQRGFCLHFVYNENTQDFELTLEDLKSEATNSNYTVTEKDILEDANLDTTGLFVVSSYNIKYISAETKQIENEIVDDFVLSDNNVEIQQQKNIIVTSEVLQIGDNVRINNEYRIVDRVGTGYYSVNIPFNSSGIFNLYLAGETTLKYGLRRAYVELDYTSDIDTQSEANYFGNLLLEQNLDIFAEYKFTVFSKDFFKIKNFDSININSPKFNLFSKDMIVQSVNETFDRTTFTVSQILNIGKYKYYNMRTEKGNNNIFTTVNIDTKDIFPPLTNLEATEPITDVLGGFQVYSIVSWNKLIGRNVVSYELQYKKNNEDWENAEVITLKSNSVKIILKEKSLYNIRVKAVGKEQVSGQWTNIDLDNTSLVINPIRDRTWFVDVNLFDNNINDYMTEFDKIGYSIDFLKNNVDLVYLNIAENFECSLQDLSVACGRRFANYSTGINQTPDNYKNFYVKGSKNGEVILDLKAGQQFGSFINVVNPILNLEGEKDTTKLKSILYTRRNLITLEYFHDYGSFGSYTTNQDKIKNIIVELQDFDTPLQDNDVTTIICPSNEVENVKITSLATDYTRYKVVGFSYCNTVEHCEVSNVFKGFEECRGMNRNKSEVIAGGTKYDNCYVSKDTSLAVPVTGGDNPNAGFNI